MALNGGGEGVCINPRNESSKISLEVLTHIFYFCVASLNREHRTYMISLLPPPPSLKFTYFWTIWHEDQSLKILLKSIQK